MALNAEESVTYRVHSAFNYPLVQRCSELTKLMEQSSFKDSHSLFPVVVESVFGFGSYHPGWGLNHHHLQPREFDSVRHFVSPEGPLVLLAYRLMNDGYLKYEFPVSCLPSVVIRSIEDGVVPPFYYGKLQSVSPGQRIPNSLLLNPFEFLVFHLSYFLIKAQNQKTYLDWNNGGDALYAFIIEDYLQCFLPCSGSFPPPPPYSLNAQSSVASRFVGKVVQSSKLTVASNLTSIFKSPDRDRQPSKNLFKQPSVTRQSSAVGPQPRDGGYVELWRSEVFVQALVEFWLDHYAVEKQHSFHPSDKSRSNQWGSSLETSWITDGSPLHSHSSFREPFFPSIDHVRLLRMCIKHFHYFANSARPISTNNFDEFKRAVIPQLVQKKLYAFIHHMFNHWPLDSSFRLVLELWLSYIQPWRYVGSLVQSSPKVEEVDRVVLSKWRPFIEQNLLFYTLFFQKMIPRLFRVDLCTLKNASMLHRVTKVFSQTNVEKILREADALLHEQTGRTVGVLSPSVSHHSILSRSATEAGHAGLIRQHVSELEGPSHVYVPLFGEEVMNQIKRLHQLIQRAKDAISDGQQTLSKPQSKKGFFSGLSSFFELGGGDGYGGGSGVASDGHKVEQYLNMALSQLEKLFQIQTVQRGPFLSTQTPRPFGASSSPGESILTQNGTLTPHGRYQLLNRICEPELAFRGDPDRQPIRSYEVAFLVRLLFQFALTFNRKFALDIENLYERDDFFGRFCRQFIQPPTVCYTFQNYGTPSTRERTILPPRISLRALGSKQNLGYIFGIVLVAHHYGYGVFAAVFFMVAAVSIVATFRVILELFNKTPNTDRDRSPRRETLDSVRRVIQMDSHVSSD